MGSLKAENLKKCVSLLREFIDESSEANNKKGIAKLALDQLQRITAGTELLFNGCDSPAKPLAELKP
ncbi:MAG: hypothetical protein JSV88_26160 [Candidatus Aminicenantes bacterium]|nr:MAG: hypothetical protein JSV88_26160 [Candidatus Aminicenantes bacterium]